MPPSMCGIVGPQLTIDELIKLKGSPRRANQKACIMVLHLNASPSDRTILSTVLKIKRKGVENVAGVIEEVIAVVVLFAQISART